MQDMKQRHQWFTWFIIGSFLHSTAWGLYFALTRIYVARDLGGGYTLLMTLAAIEYATPLSSILWGILADKLGRKTFVIVGWSGFLPLALLGFIRDPYLFVAVAALPSLAWAAGWPSIVSPVVSRPRIGFSYGMFMLGSSIGWGLGSILMGLIYWVTGSAYLVFVAAGIFYFMAYAIFYYNYPSRVPSDRLDYKTLKALFKTMLPLLAAVMIMALGVDWSFNVVSVKLEDRVRTLLEEVWGSSNLRDVRLMYGIFYGGVTSLIGAPARIIAGKIVDKWGGVKTLIVTSISYALLFQGIIRTTGLVSIILWTVPLFPFYDTSIYSAASALAPQRYKASVAGAVVTAQSIGGSLVFLVGGVTDKYGELAAINIATMIIIATIVPLMFTLLKREQVFR